MAIRFLHSGIQLACLAALLLLFMPVFFISAAPNPLRAQVPTAPSTQNPAVPDWALPASATHMQVSPPSDFHRPSRNFNTSIGIFDGQSDIGSAIIPGSASYDAGTGQYTVTSAGYNIWYVRDEFRYLWKKMFGDVSRATDIAYPDPKDCGDRKAVLIIRQNLDDDSKEAIVALHGAGMIHLAQRPDKGLCIKDMEYRIGGRGPPAAQALTASSRLSPVASASRSMVILSHFLSAWKGNQCTSSGR
jgi:hypothetical protein